MGDRDNKSKRDDVKGAFERFRAAVRDSCKPGVQAKLLQAIDLVEQGFMAGRLPLDGAKASLQQVRGNARRQMRENPIDMVRLLKAIDGMEDEIVQFFTSLEDGP